jgi:DNA-binding PadR family transcriptional regulator
MITMKHSTTKGFLTLLILWIIRRKSMTGAEIALELQKRKGRKLSPGTIYPVLKHMKERDLVSIDNHKSYTLTKKGEKSLENHLQEFIRTFHDIDEMKSCCCKHKLINTKFEKDEK